MVVSCAAAGVVCVVGVCVVWVCVFVVGVFCVCVCLLWVCVVNVRTHVYVCSCREGVEADGAKCAQGQEGRRSREEAGDTWLSWPSWRGPGGTAPEDNHTWPGEGYYGQAQGMTEKWTVFQDQHRNNLIVRLVQGK